MSDLGLEESVNLRRIYGVRHAIATNVGIIIGSSIFITPAGVIKQANSSGLALLLWFVAGLITLMNGLVYVELGNTIPKCGGIYAYLAKMYPSCIPFIYLWTYLIILRSGYNALKCLVFSEYSISLFLPGCDIPDSAYRIVALLIVSLVVFIDCITVRWSALAHAFTVVTTICTLSFISIVGLLWIAQGKSGDHLKNMFEDSTTRPDRIILALYSGYISFSGASAMNVLIEELRNPKRNLLLGVLLSLLIVGTLYILTNLAYLGVLGKDGVIQSNAIAVAFSSRTLGGALPYLISVLVALTNAGSLHIGILMGSRINFAGGRRGQIPKLFSLLSVKFSTPILSVITQGILTMVVILALDVLTIIRYLAFCDAVIEVLVIGGLCYMRRTKPDMPSPIKMPYILVVSQLLIMSGFLIIPAVYEPYESLKGVLICFLPPIVCYVACNLWTPKPAWLRRGEEDVLIFTQKLLFGIPKWDD